MQTEMTVSKAHVDAGRVYGRLYAYVHIKYGAAGTTDFFAFVRTLMPDFVPALSGFDCPALDAAWRAADAAGEIPACYATRGPRA